MLLAWLRRRPATKGQSMTELAISLPVILIMLMGLIELGFIIKTKLVLQDAVRTGVRYGSMAGTDDGTTTAYFGAAGCAADFAMLDDFANRLPGTVVDPSHIRAILIFSAQQDNTPQVAPAQNGLQGTAGDNPHPNDLLGDYYYALYDSNGANTSTLTDLAGTPPSPIWQLFNGQETQIFSASSIASPHCGQTLLAGSPAYPDPGSIFTPAHYVDTGPPQGAWTGSGETGGWPPKVRNKTGELPQVIGVTMVYDYQFHTPLFNFIANFAGAFLHGNHFLRMTDSTSYYLNP